MPNIIRLVSYNILHDHPKFTGQPKYNWEDRKPYLLKHLQCLQPNILAIQEGCTSQINAILQQFSHFDHYTESAGGPGGGEQLAIFFDKNQFQKTYQSTFWLSETPQVPSKDWESAHFRICSYVGLTHQTSGELFFCFNTHLDHRSALARKAGTQVILKEIEKIKTKHPKAHLILTGDFNANKQSAVYQVLSKSTLLEDARLSTASTKKIIPYTFVGIDKKWTLRKLLLHLFYPKFMHQQIDYIFVSLRLPVINYQISVWSYEGIYPSDHLPIIIDIQTKSHAKEQN